MTPSPHVIRDMADRFAQGGAPCRVGDIVVDRDYTPIGTIDAVLNASSGVRLVITIAGFRDRYVVVPAVEVCGQIAPPFGPASRHITSALRLEILDGPVYRREMGRLTKDPTRVDPFPFPSKDGWTDFDNVTRTALRDGLSQSRLTAGEPIEHDVWHGAVHLYGRVATDAGVIDASRIAFAATGAWLAVSTLVSDEALGMHLRRHIRGSDAAAAVAAVAVAKGIGVITTFGDATLDPKTLESWHLGTPGLASISVGPPRTR